jgi:hypothetical protein
VILLALVLGITAALADPHPAAAQTRPMPPGHPRILDPQPPPPGLPTPPDPGRQALTWTVPPTWTTETPSSTVRRAQYRVPGPGGAGECIVYYFGPGQGGDAKSNVDRWASQFRRPDGSPVGDPKTQTIKVGDIPIVLVEVAGTYVGGMGGTPAGPARPDQMLLGAIVEGPEAGWFFRATGPRATIEAQRAAFDRMVRSIKRAPRP